VRIRQAEGHIVSAFKYQSHEVVQGKPPLPVLPATFGDAADATTIVVHLYDEYSDVAADLTYMIFPKYDAVVRSTRITNKGENSITIETLASVSVDFPSEELETVGLRGDWAREAHRQRQKVSYGV
jgi:alpha-galactosidase